jgi:hypothetical protein
MVNTLKITEEYLTFEEDQAEGFVQTVKDESAMGKFDLVGYSINKKTKKDLDYFIVKIVKEFNREKDLTLEA